MEGDILDFGRNWRSDQPIQSVEDFLGNPEAQEIAFAKFIDRNRAGLRMSPHGFANVGQKVIAPDGRNFVVTEGGLMAALHREGIGALRDYLAYVSDRG